MLCFRLMGILICIHPSYFILISFLFFIGSGFLAIGVVFFSLIHELSHGLMASKLGYTPVSISTCLFGGELKLYESYLESPDGLLIHLSGPLSNLLLATLFFCIDTVYPGPVTKTAILSNLMLALFNLLPFYPLDGGKIVKIYLSILFTPIQAWRITKVLSYFFIVFLFLFGIYLIQYNPVNLLISAMAVNLYLAGRGDSRYSYKYLKQVYRELERNNQI